MSTIRVDQNQQELIEKVATGSEEELNELKTFLFKENIRIEMEKRELEELQERIFADRERLRRESDEVSRKIVSERKRLKEEQMFFDKKMEILKNGFTSLEMDRKALKNARLQFEREKREKPTQSYYADNNIVFLFKGVTSLLSLKKRYKDLLKIFHPDNMGGDHEMVLAINKVYDELKKNYDSSKII